MEIIEEFIDALNCEIEALKRGQGTNIINIYDGKFLNKISEFYVYRFNLENFLTIIEDTPAVIEINDREYECEIISINGQQIQIALKGKFPDFIPIAKLKTSTWYLLEILKKKYEETLKDKKRFENSYRLFSGSFRKIEDGNFYPSYSISDDNVNESQHNAIISSLNNFLCIIWGPPGTGKTYTIAKAIESHLNLGRKILLLSHSNNAVDEALEKVASQTQNSYYQKCQLVRVGIPKAEKLEFFKSEWPLVLIDEIVKHKSAPLIHQKEQLLIKLAEIDLKLQRYENIVQLINQIKDFEVEINDLYLKLKTVEKQYEKLKKKSQDLKIKIDKQNIKLEKAKTAGVIKRIFLGLNSEKLIRNINRLTSQLNTINKEISNLENTLIEIRKTIKIKEAKLIDTKKSLDTGSNIDDIKQSIKELTDHQKYLSAEIEKIEKELEGLKIKILSEATLVATTLTKSYISKEIEHINFDILIVDEASMAPLPMLFWAASKVKKGITIVGDFMQLPPIAVAESEIADKWLKRNIFNVLGLDNVSRATPDKVSLLKWQYRMNPLISEIPRTRIYGNKLVDAEGTEDKIIYDEISEYTPICLIDTSSHNPWCSQLEKGRFNLISALISVYLAEKVLKSLQNNKLTNYNWTVGIITPYRNQARLILKIAEDKNLVDLIKVNTVHSFQGGEETVIIFDCVEGLGARNWSLINEAHNGEEAKRLLNVALTRPERKLYLVANKDYLKQTFSNNTLLIDILHYFEKKGVVKKSTELFNNLFKEGDLNYWVKKINSLHNRPSNETEIFSDTEFWPAFINDLAHINKELIIFSPFITTFRIGRLQNYFRELISKGINIFVITLPPNQQHNTRMREDSLKALKYLRSLGVVIKFRDKMHEKIALIDKKIKWVGSLNILSHNNQREYMERFVGEHTVEELYNRYDLENLFSNSNLVGNKCPNGNCDGFIIIRRQHRNPWRKFYGCTNYPHCKWTKDL